MISKRRKSSVVTRGLFFSTCLSLLLLPVVSYANQEPLPSQNSLNLSLPIQYTAPPPEGVQHNLNITSNIFKGALSGLKIPKTKTIPLGIKRVKIDKTMKVRGWKIKEDFYVGYTKVGKESGIGMMMTSGNFAYGLNNKGVGMTYKTENSRLRLNMQEVSMKIKF